MLEELRETFFQECRDLLAALEADLSALSEGRADGQAIISAHRAAHSIKGGAGAFSFTRIARLAERLEAALREVRDGGVEASPDALALFGSAVKALGDLVRAERAGAALDPEREKPVSDALGALTGGGREAPEATLTAFEPTPLEMDAATMPDPAAMRGGAA